MSLRCLLGMSLRELTDDLVCAFPGFSTTDVLAVLYYANSASSAPTRVEPCGMRVTYALLCGAPIIISRGTHKLIIEYGVGASLAAGGAVDLAWQIRPLTDEAFAYGLACPNLASARDQLLLAAAAKRVPKVLRRQCSGHLGRLDCTAMAKLCSETFESRH